MKSAGGTHKQGSTSNNRRASRPTLSPTTPPRPTATGAAGTNASSPHASDDEDDDDAVNHADNDNDTANDREDQKADREKLALLVDAFDAEQSARYAMFRRVKFRKETVRKITNYVVSQSVPPSVVLTVNGFAKSFVGVLIERARRVQVEAAAAAAVAGDGGSGGRARKGGEAVEVDPTDFVGAGRGGAAGSGGVDPARLVFGGGSARVVGEGEGGGGGGAFGAVAAGAFSGGVKKV